MGYQLVERRGGQSNGDFYILLNAAILVRADELFSPHVLRDLVRASADEESLLSDLDALEGVCLSDDWEAYRKIAALPESPYWSQSDLSRPLHSSPPLEGQTQPRDQFVRFSAFRNDRRITADGRLMPGTYATTFNDSQHASSGLAAVGRYALPNRVPARWRFDFVVFPNCPIKYGTVNPAFGQAGGGVEVEFVDGIRCEYPGLTVEFPIKRSQTINDSIAVYKIPEM